VEGCRRAGFPGEGESSLDPGEEATVTEQDVLGRIKDLVGQEHQLRAKAESGELDPGDERARLADLEVMLDQCWDLLRQRRARADQGADPDEAEVNTAKQVEGYLQ
jgi:hypothetical protein